MNPFIQWAQKHGLIATPTPASRPTAAALATPAPVLHSPAAPPATVALPMAKETTTMTDTIVQDVENVAGATAGAVEQKAEQVATSVMTFVLNGATKVWEDVESLADAQEAKIKAALPASAQGDLAAVVSDVKQGASDVISLGADVASVGLPVLATEGEKLLDQAMATYSNGVALPLVPLVNKGIDQIANAAIATAKAWALKTKAALATPA